MVGKITSQLGTRLEKTCQALEFLLKTPVLAAPQLLQPALMQLPSPWSSLISPVPHQTKGDTTKVPVPQEKWLISSTQGGPGENW